MRKLQTLTLTAASKTLRANTRNLRALCVQQDELRPSGHYILPPDISPHDAVEVDSACTRCLVALRGAMYFTLKVTEPDLLIYPSWIVILDNVLPPLFTLWMCFVFTSSENDRFFPLWFSGPCSFHLRLLSFTAM